MLEVGAGAARSSGWGPGLLFGGAGILVYRTIALLARARAVLRWWVVASTVLEMVVDVGTLVAAGRWWMTRVPDHSRLGLRFGAAATLLHAVRVLVFVLGRTGPWVDFDVRPGHRADHRGRWTWGGVIFAGVMSVLGIVGVGAIWAVRRPTAAHDRPGPRARWIRSSPEPVGPRD